jgi:hypothetical protein
MQSVIDRLTIDSVIKASAIGLLSVGTFRVINYDLVGVIKVDSATGKKVSQVVERKSESPNSAYSKSKSDEETFFAISNTISQLFMPKIVEDDNIQRILVNPLIAAFATTLYKDSKKASSGRGFALKSYISALSAAAVVTLPLNNLIK